MVNRSLAPDRAVVIANMRAVLTGEMSREEAASWASQWSMREVAPVHDAVVWDALSDLAGVDLRTGPETYLFGPADLEAWIETVEKAERAERARVRPGEGGPLDLHGAALRRVESTEHECVLDFDGEGPPVRLSIRGSAVVQTPGGSPRLTEGGPELADLCQVLVDRGGAFMEFEAGDLVVHFTDGARLIARARREGPSFEVTVAERLVLVG